MIKLERPECPHPSALTSEDYKHPINKKALREASFDKCMYCESKISHTQYGDIEHIQPKSKFPELEFLWQNLGFVCTKCNGAKSDKFDSDCHMIDPYKENPENHIIACGSFLSQKKGCEKGENTINTIKLNRLCLIERRKEKIDNITKSIDRCFRSQNEAIRNNALAELKKEADPDKEYSLCVKNLLRAHEI